MAKIALIEDNAALAEKLIKFLQLKFDFEVILASSAVDALLEEAVNKLPPDIILLDINLKGQSSLDAIPLILANLPNAKIIIMTSHLSADLVIEAISKGAHSYYIKGADLNELIKAIEITSGGGAYIDPLATPALVGFLHKSTRRNNPHQPVLEEWQRNGLLAPREVQVIEGLLEDLSYKEIAGKNNIGLNTVRHYVKSVYKKLNINNRAQLRTRFLTPQSTCFIPEN